MSFLNFGWLRRLRVLAARTRLEREMDDEMRFHVEMEAAELQRVHGLAADEARRQALITFGGVERHREAGREARGIAWVNSMSLDVKLGLRMLRKHAALSVIGGLGMAVAIAIATGFFTFTTSFYYSHPPLAEGERIVAVENRNLQNSEDWVATLFDFHTWREELKSVQDLAAFRRRARNLQVPGGRFERVQVAEMTASGFRMARVPPLLGRPLLDADEQQGAPPVVVLGHAEWQRLFNADPGVIGRQVRLGGTAYEIVGVMPEGFRFPSNYGVWTALPTTRSLYGPGTGPKVLVFGRIAPDVARASAQAELTAIGRRLSVSYPDVYEHFRPTLVRYVHALLDVQQYPAWSVWLMQLLGVLLLTVVAVNVAVLVYARTAARRAEITVRTALGAGRQRIVGQLFLEALVLSLLAAALGLVIAQVGYRQIAALASFEMMLPYWIGRGLSAATIPYAAGLAVLAAFLVGVLPALRATGRNLQSALRGMDGGQIQMGATWTLLIVVQVAIAVAVLPTVVAIAAKSIWKSAPTPTFPAEELLAVRLSRDEDTRPPDAAMELSYATQETELIRRITAEPGVAGVTFALNGPPFEERVGIETDRASPATETLRARARPVDVAYFDVFGVALLAGRRFAPGDIGGNNVIVSRAFVQRFFGGGDAVGRSIRKTNPDGRARAGEASYQIVGVVADMYVNPAEPNRAEAILYHPAERGAARPSVAVRTRGTTPAQLAPRVQQIAREVAPDWQPVIGPLDNMHGAEDQKTMRFVAVVVGLMTLSVLLLSAAGISALMSFAVTRRHREIGIRAALGAPRDRIVASIFSRSAAQLATGLAVGAAAASALDRASGGELLGGHAVLLLPLVAVLMVLAGLLATLGPARRALRIHPMEALRQE